MATKLENLEIDIAFYNYLEPQLIAFSKQKSPKFKMCAKTKEWYLETGLIQVSTVFETVMAYLTSSTVSSLDTNDLSNGADCKLTTARTSSHGKKYSAPIKDVYHKSGTLYVLCYERIHKKFYFFAIPNHTYCMIAKTSNIEIPFNLDGSPRRTPIGKKTYANWWDFECTSLQDMATVCGTTGVRNTQSNTSVATPVVPTWAHLFIGL